MNPNPNIEKDLFAEALELPPEQREGYLKGACRGDEQLRLRVEDLLRVHSEASGILATEAKLPTIKLDLPDAPDETVGQTVGRYKLLEKLGEGGCGVVYVAEQTEPVRRRVALKVIKLGMDTKAVVARFEAERQALAMMDHPNIAKVLDAGTTGAPNSQLSTLNPQLPQGRPYFVMELVRGIRITDYCNQADLSTKERLDLFIKVCHAIQHAHQKGIIHRDIKPSNILVTLHDGVPVPKVIDFGIAKATEGRLTDATVYTQLHQFIGTPAYMSPEQAEMSGLDIDTRSDIYSLGVLLYELLAGSTPFDAKELMASGIDAMRKTIREKEPMRPSTKLIQTLGAADAVGRVTPRAPSSGESNSTDGAHEVTRPTAKSEEEVRAASRRLLRIKETITLLRGDLDWIVMKCLEKDRARRYDTANGLATDIQRHLNNETVIARPPSTTYRLQKTFRRNKLAFIAVSAVGLALTIGLGFSTVSFLRERQAHSEAETRRREAETAREGEARQRKLADQQKTFAEASAKRATENELHSRRLLYAADMNLAQQSLNANNLGRARRLLDRYRPAGSRSNEVQSFSNINNQSFLTSAALDDLRGWEWRYLWQECRSDALTLLTKDGWSGGSALSVSLSADSRLLAVGYGNGRVELWDVPARRLQKVLIDGSGTSYAYVAFSPNSDLLAATAAPGLVKLYNLVTASESIRCDVQPASVRDLSFSNDGGLLTVLGLRGTNSPVLVLDTMNGHLLSSNSITTRRGMHFNNARLSADHQRLYLSQGDVTQPRLQCVRLPDGQVLWEKDGRDIGFTAMDVSPDGRFLVTGTGYEFSTIQVWDAQTGEALTRLESHSSWIAQLTFSRDGRVLASASADQTLRLWNTSTWTESAVLRGHGDEVYAVAFSADGQFLASGSKDGAVMLWDARAPNLRGGRQSLPAHIEFASALPGSQALVARSTNGVWSVIELATLRETRLPISSRDRVTFRSPNYLGTYDGTNRFRLYEVTASGLQQPREMSVGSSSSAEFAYRPNNRMLAWCDDSQTIQVASLDQASKRTILTNDTPLIPVKFCGAGRYLLAVTPSSSARTAVVWDLTTGKEVARTRFTNEQGAELVANEGSALVTFPIGGGVEIRNLLAAERAPRRFQQRAVWYDVAFSPDARIVAVCTKVGKVVLYDTLKQEELAILHGHLNATCAAAFSPDGTRLASTCSGAESVKLWDMATHQELLTLPGRGSLLGRAEFTDDGNTLLVGSSNQAGSFQFWRAPSWAEIEATEAKDTESTKPQ